MKVKTIYAPDAAEAVAFAAEELTSYLERMLPEEGELAVSLAVCPEADGAGHDWFSVRLSKSGGAITGNSGRAVLLGVYDCLRRLGCRFLAPGKANEVVPVIRPQTIDLEYGHRASFRHRGVCIEGADSRENVLDYIDWLPKLGYNCYFPQFKVPYIFYARWYHHDRNPLRAPEPYTVEDAERDSRAAEREAKRRGLMLHKMGHGWTGQVLGFEAVSWDQEERPLDPALQHRAAQVNGVRGLHRGVPANTNLCYHNGDAIDAFAALVAEYARNDPDADYVHVWLADEYNNICECDDCQRTTPSDQYVELLNEIDRRLTTEGLSTKIVFLLYQELLWPPIRARLAHPERFVLMFAPISRTFEQSYQLPDTLPDLPPYVRNQVTLPTSLSENLAFLRGWQDQFQGDSFVYDYPLGRAHYGDFGYVKLARVISGDIKRLKQLGLNGYISCQELRSALPNALPNYVMGRTLMDESAEVNDLIHEYFSAAYGDAWAEVSHYLWELSALSSTDYVNGKGPRTDAEMAERMERIQASCQAFAPEIGEHRTESGWENPFWQVLDYHREYVLALSKAVRRLTLGDEAEAAGQWRAFRQLICEREPDFQPWVDAYRVLEVTEKYTGFRGDAKT